MTLKKTNEQLEEFLNIFDDLEYWVRDTVVSVDNLVDCMNQLKDWKLRYKNELNELKK